MNGWCLFKINIWQSSLLVRTFGVGFFMVIYHNNNKNKPIVKILINFPEGVAISVYLQYFCKNWFDSCILHFFMFFLVSKFALKDQIIIKRAEVPRCGLTRGISFGACPLGKLIVTTVGIEIIGWTWCLNDCANSISVIFHVYKCVTG